MVTIFPAPLSTETHIVLLSQETHVKFWTHHKSPSSCLLPRVSVPIEQLQPLKICPIIWMQMQYFIGRKEITQLPRSYPNFAMIMAFWKESCCFGEQFSIMYQEPRKVHSLLEDCSRRRGSQGNSQSCMKRYVQGSISQCCFSQNKFKTM